jgi:hypothetical protein
MDLTPQMRRYISGRGQLRRCLRQLDRQQLQLSSRNYVVGILALGRLLAAST